MCFKFTLSNHALSAWQVGKKCKAVRKIEIIFVLVFTFFFSLV